MSLPFTKKNPTLPSPQPTAARDVEEPLSAFAGQFATRIELLETSLRNANEYARAQEQRARVAEATLEALKKEFDHIRAAQDQELHTLRNHCDHWQEQAVKYKSRLKNFQALATDALNDEETEHPPPKAATIAQPLEELENALLPMPSPKDASHE